MKEKAQIVPHHNRYALPTPCLIIQQICRISATCFYLILQAMLTAYSNQKFQSIQRHHANANAIRMTITPSIPQYHHGISQTRQYKTRRLMIAKLGRNSRQTTNRHPTCLAAAACTLHPATADICCSRHSRDQREK